MTDAQRTARSLPPSSAQANRRPAIDPPLKHVIDEYKHKAQTVTCVCGWHGSTAVAGSGPSDWSLHVAANRTARS